MDNFWKPFVALGVPGVALGVFYKLYDKLDWGVKNLPPMLQFILALAWMMIIGGLIFYALRRYAPHHEPKAKSGVNKTSVSIPKNCSFRVAAERIPPNRLVSFEGFTQEQLAVKLNPQEYEASNDIEAIKHLYDLAGGKLPKFDVVESTNGKFIVKAN